MWPKFHTQKELFAKMEFHTTIRYGKSRVRLNVKWGMGAKMKDYLKESRRPNCSLSNLMSEWKLNLVQLSKFSPISNVAHKENGITVKDAIKKD
jgi:hypothetical protein